MFWPILSMFAKQVGTFWQVLNTVVSLVAMFFNSELAPQGLTRRTGRRHNKATDNTEERRVEMCWLMADNPLVHTRRMASKDLLAGVSRLVRTRRTVSKHLLQGAANRLAHIRLMASNLFINGK